MYLSQMVSALSMKASLGGGLQIVGRRGQGSSVLRGVENPFGGNKDPVKGLNLSYHNRDLS